MATAADESASSGPGTRPVAIPVALHAREDLSPRTEISEMALIRVRLSGSCIGRPPRGLSGQGPSWHPYLRGSHSWRSCTTRRSKSQANFHSRVHLEGVVESRESPAVPALLLEAPGTRSKFEVMIHVNDSARPVWVSDAAHKTTHPRSR